MKSKILGQYLVIEIMGVLSALLLFKTIKDSRIAGIFAGLGFISIGLYIIKTIHPWKKKWTSPTFWFVHIHVWIMTLPFLVIRIRNWELPIDKISLFSINGVRWHHFSETIYSILMISTLIDLFRLLFFSHKVPKSS
ncbi:MAG: hypothetical protein K1X29_11365 [Bdellovibrionales bacterium]|nr:hypothetical protein [Bdellovibrionales bacterium]